MGRYALLIGVGTYGKGLQPLPAAPRDVTALQEVLANPQMGGFDEVKPLVNPTQPEMAESIELWFQGRQPEDLVLLFFSGHGVKDDRRDLYFAAANTRKQRDLLLTSSAISARFIHACIRRCKAKHQVLILDCCFSGAFGELMARDDGEVPLKDQLGAEGRVVLTSTSAVDYSFEEKGADLSIYTRYLVEGIASGAADDNGDGVISIDELHRYAGRKVKETSPVMSPTLIILKDEGFRIQIARSSQDYPRLKYRKEAERRATAEEFTIPARRILASLRAELQISDTEAEAIEDEVLKPHREYQRKRQEYQATLYQCLDHESILSVRTINDLRDLQAHFQLKPEDVVTIEQAALNGHDLKGYAAEVERQRQVEAQQRVEVKRNQRERVETERRRAAEAAQKQQAEATAQSQQRAERQKQAEEKRKKQAAAHQPTLWEYDFKEIVDYFAEEFQRNEGIDLRKDSNALKRLTGAAIKATIELSKATQAEINLPFISATQDGPKHLDMTLTQAKLVELIGPSLKKIVDYLAKEFQHNEGIDLRKDSNALKRLTGAAIKAKIELSKATQAEINLPFISATQNGPKHLETTLTRAKLEELIQF